LELTNAAWLDSVCLQDVWFLYLGLRKSTGKQWLIFRIYKRKFCTFIAILFG